jgi:RNA polymerase sigma factor (sigma-70 family)
MPISTALNGPALPSAKLWPQVPWEPPRERSSHPSSNSMSADDMTLLQRWRGGDRQAGDALIRRHYAFAFGIAKHRLGNDDAAAEATQHAMMVVVQKRDVIETDFQAYLTKVVYFSILSQTKRREHEPLDDQEPPRSSQRGAVSILAEREEEKLLVKALRSMSIDDQLLFYYQFVGDHTRTEIAELLQIAPNRTYVHIHRAKQRLQRQVEQFRMSPVRQSTLGGLDTWLASLHDKVQASE